MKICVIETAGRAAPWVMQDVAWGFRQLGHEVSDNLYDAELFVGYGANGLIGPLGDKALCVWYDNPLDEGCFDQVALHKRREGVVHFVWDKYWTMKMWSLGFRGGRKKGEGLGRSYTYYHPIGVNTEVFRPVTYEYFGDKVFEGFPALQKLGENNKRDDLEIQKKIDIAKYGNCQAAFVGSMNAVREHVITELVQRGIDVAVWGYGWDEAADVEVRRRFRGVADNRTELAKIYHYGRCQINITANQGLSSQNMRVQDCMAVGGYVVSDVYEEDCYLPSEMVWENIDDLKSKIVNRPGLLGYHRSCALHTAKNSYVEYCKHALEAFEK